jgi:hypothetical protein
LDDFIAKLRLLTQKTGAGSLPVCRKRNVTKAAFLRENVGIRRRCAAATSRDFRSFKGEKTR